MHVEIRRLERAPAQSRVDERQLRPLRPDARQPGQQQQREPAFQSSVPPMARAILISAPGGIVKLPDQKRRRLMAAAAASIALGPAGARAQGFPSKNMRVVVPTAQGGGADRLARVFDDFWGPRLKTNFEYGFFPGAAGQVGYEVYLHKRDKDAHNLLFGNMGPEMIMYALQKPSYRFPQDYQYFCRLDVDDSIMFVLKHD